MVIDLPEGVRARDITITIKPNLLKLRLKDGVSFEEKVKAVTQKDGSLAPTLLTKIKNGLHLSHTVDPDISAWSLDEGQLVITLGKRESKDWTEL